MKLIHLPILGLILASSAFSADLSPNTLGPLSDVSNHLVYKPLLTSEYHLGLDFIQALEAGEDKVIERRMNVEVGLPLQTSFGFSLVDTQEYAFDHSVKPFGAYAWLRWNMIATKLITVSSSLQFQPGLSTRESSYQASQDRTSLGLDVKLQPLDYVSTAVYAAYSRRQDERYQDMTLGNESLAGFRLALGTKNLGVYGDGSQRYLETSGKRLFARTWQAGAYVGTDSLQASIFSLIPDTNRYPGTFERGYGISLSARIGGAPASNIDQPEDAIKAVNKADNATMEAARKVEKEPEIKILETNEMDDFQLLEQKEKQAAKNQKESAAEKAEREMREALAKEKKLEAQKAIEQEKAKQAAAQSTMQIREDDPKVQEYRDEVNQEINAYTLPDQEDLNWNGLNTK